ncbi:MAG: hypothetical protein CVU87_04685 [Firmicutes bacterium HGW-Firmicutes-12]|nr:MAG: hypothetical protein CVU87_04685 [Firmicutes bacterium HGW-Firmicutes-12]
MMNTGEQSHNRTSLYTMPLIRYILLVILVLLIINMNFLPAGFIIFIILIVEFARIWSKISLHNLEIVNSIFPSRLFPDEETTLKIEIYNKKHIPVNLSWTQALIPQMQEIQTEERKRSSFNGHKMLGRFDKNTSKYKIVAAKRGYYRLPPLVIEAKDGLGLFEKTKILSNPAVIVYPRIRPINELELNPSDLIGDRKDNRPLLPDPIRIAGLRDYTPDMPSRFINWKASASKDDLLAKMLEPSADLRICITVDTETFCQPLQDVEPFEEALSVAASLAFWADNNKVPFGLIVNGHQKEHNCPIVMPISGAPDQISLALEALARLELTTKLRLSDLIKMESATFPLGTTIIVIVKGTARPDVSSLRNIIYYSIGKED